MSTPQDIMNDTEVSIGHLVTDELLNGLRRAYPLLRPLATDTERSIFLKSGNQEVIEFLERQRDEAVHRSLTQG
jgi:hypothetical protein